LREPGIAAVVWIVSATIESPLPERTCAGLNKQVVSAGSFEQEKLTSLGNTPVVGLTSILKLAAWPADTDVLPGVIPMVKSKFWFGSAVKVTGAEWVIAEGSLPTPTILKLYACDTLLETVTVNGAPPDVGVTLAGFIVQLDGAFTPQVSVTALL
jgi:hypothetical protein